MINQLRALIAYLVPPVSGPQGEPGPSGPRGLRGLSGPPGQDYTPPEPILPLRLDVVAVTDSRDMDYLWRVKRAMVRFEAWWAYPE